MLSTCLSGQAQSSKQLIIKDRVDASTTLAREPMVAEHPNGDLFLSGYQNASESPQLWRSTDKGKNWQSVDVGGIAEGADGNSDVDLLIDEQDCGPLLTMKYTRFPEDMTNFDFSSMKGEHIAVGVSE